jgi:hypothetical protein
LRIAKGNDADLGGIWVVLDKVSATGTEQLIKHGLQLGDGRANQPGQSGRSSSAKEVDTVSRR